MEEVLKILAELHPDVDFRTEKNLVEGEILNSFDIISIVGELNHSFGIEINAEDLLPGNFNSAEAIYGLVCRLLDE
mgnify:FL=1